MAKIVGLEAVAKTLLLEEIQRIVAEAPKQRAGSAGWATFCQSVRPVLQSWVFEGRIIDEIAAAAATASVAVELSRDE